MAGGHRGIGQGLRAWVVSLGRPGEESPHSQLSLRIPGSLEQKSGRGSEPRSPCSPLPRPVTSGAPWLLVAPTTPPPAPGGWFCPLRSALQSSKGDRLTETTRMGFFVLLAKHTGASPAGRGPREGQVLPTSCRLGPVKAPGGRRQEALRSPPYVCRGPAHHETPSSQRIVLTTRPAALGLSPLAALEFARLLSGGAGPREARHGTGGSARGRGRLLGLEPGQSRAGRPDAGKGTSWGSPRPLLSPLGQSARKAFPDCPEHGKGPRTQPSFQGFPASRLAPRS